jgi:hypothetical protein
MAFKKSLEYNTNFCWDKEVRSTQKDVCMILLYPEKPR